ncbi:YciI family protein [Synechococcus sp. NOUM97013]|uniref:YciI family protein n=1 Tax=Synechococcus sp. NOUM97013 TaxID=1442555 RepID=UPI00164488C5|nr:YciI family protein [Synechococcus sp. NOUM97013]QNI74021.1 YCII-like domain-containing protein [Synechococcus sp. NOUM97013]
MARFVLWGTYCDDALQKREPFRDEHLNRLKQLKESGTLVTLGPTEGSTHVFGVFESDSVSSVRTLLEADVYWREGIWTHLDVYPWIQAF